VDDSARMKRTTEREGTDGTTRVAGRRWAPEDSCGGGLEAGQTRATRGRPPGDARRTTIQRSTIQVCHPAHLSNPKTKYYTLRVSIGVESCLRGNLQVILEVFGLLLFTVQSCIIREIDLHRSVTYIVLTCS
jgi:hypothetical protein